jgi:Ca2+-dependent lipid-binding protein
LLTVYLDSAKLLPVTSDTPRAMVALETLQSGEKNVTTRPVLMQNPVFREGFSFLLGKVEKEVLKIKVYDEESDYVFGCVEMAVSDLLADPEDLKVELKGYEFSNESSGSVRFSARLRYLVPSRHCGKESSHSLQVSEKCTFLGAGAAVGK